MLRYLKFVSDAGGLFPWPFNPNKRYSMRTTDFLTPQDELRLKIERQLAAIASTRIKIFILMILLYFILFVLVGTCFWVLTYQLKDQDHKRSTPQQRGQSGIMIYGIRSDVPGSRLFLGAERKTAACSPAGGLPKTLCIPVKKVIFDQSLFPSPFESRQPVDRLYPYQAARLPFFMSLSDQWYFINQHLKPLPRGCIGFIQRFAKLFRGNYRYDEPGIDRRLWCTLLVHHSDYYSGIALQNVHLQ